MAQKNNGSIILKGVVWDNETGIDLSAKISAIKNGKVVSLGTTDSENKFTVSVPIPCERLIFESKGYEKIDLPVCFIGDFTKKSIASLGIETTKIGGEISIKDFVIFCYPENYKKGAGYYWYKLLPVGYKRITNFAIGFNNGNSMSHERKNGFTSYGKLVISQNDNEILYEKEIKILEGTNFIDTNIYPIKDELKEIEIQKKSVVRDSALKPETVTVNAKSKSIPEDQTSEQNTHGFTANKTIYFDQSEYTLTINSKAVLDSIATYLKQNSYKKIQVFGFTDNVGKPEDNEVLAQYRSKVVSSYLINLGIDDNRIKQNWEKSGEKLESVERNLSELRKVTIIELN